jgi:hypothetical protein
MGSNSAMRCLLAVLWLGGLCACGGDDGMPPLAARPPKDPKAGTGGDKPRDSGLPDLPKRDGGVLPPRGDSSVPPPPVDDNAPVIEMLAPAAADDPNDDTVITTDLVTASCRVSKAMTASAREVNLSTVRIMMINPSDEQHPIMGTVAALPDGEFEAEFRLTDQPNGPWKFRCEADDMNKPALTGRATVETFVDLGPTVEIIEPLDGTAHRLLGNVGIKFRVRESALSLDDTEGTPTAISLKVSGVTYAFTESQDDPGLYTGAVNFNDRAVFPMPPSTAEIVVTAQSSRTPEAPTRRDKADITIDSEGPTIVVKSPGDGVIVRSEVTLVVQITDDSGIDTDTVIGTISLTGTDYILQDWTINGSTFTETFDTRSFDPTLTQLTINIVAEDLVGNLSAPASHVLRIDNVPPVISLDPPHVREYRVTPAGKKECSAAFDPVGSDAVSDLDSVVAQAKYRVAVNERTNYAPGADLGYIAGVNKSTVRIYAQPDPAIPLLIDTDDDPNNICDEINFDALPIPQRPVAIEMGEVTDRGAAYYAADSSFLADTSRNVPAADCQTGTAVNPPGQLCNTTPMHRVLPQNIETGNPPSAVYGLMPTNSPTEGECNGTNWELLPIVDEGWACLAARAEDNIGNVGVSVPMRVCFDDMVGTPLCKNGDPTLPLPPNCTDGCALPDAWEPNLTLRAR